MENKKDMIIAIYQDQRIAEEFCNFRCEYCEGFCPTGYSLNTDKEGNLTVPNEWHDKMKNFPNEVKDFFSNGRSMEKFYQIACNVMEKTQTIVNSDILKISGGEITTNKKLVDFVSSIHDKYLSVQILTNGLNLCSEDIKEYKKMGNVSFQVSLDGVTYESNYSKSHSAIIIEKVLQNVDTMIKEGVGVEINCVLTQYNTSKFLEFLERFKEADNFMIVPRPVRGAPRENIDFSAKQVVLFEKIINENFEKYKKILAPKKYFDRLIEIMKTGKRPYNCYIPFFVLSIDGYGNFEKCPIGLLPKKNQNILAGTINLNEILTNSDYQIINDYQLCNYCIVQYEMLNLYVEGEISKKELQKMPSLNSDIIISHIDDIKQNIILNEIKRKLKEEYSIVADEIEKNDESSDGNVFVVYSKDKKYIIKLYDNITHTESMINLHSLLTTSGLNVPKIICSNKKENYITLLDKNYFVVYSFIEGEQISYKYRNLDDFAIRKIAKTLYKLHTVTSEKNNLGLPKLPFHYKEQLNRYSALHFDLTRNNIFINQNEIGLIDFDDAKYGPSICDVAIVISNLFFSKTRGVDMDGVKKFIDEYYDGKKEIKEKEVPLIKYFAIQWIDYILDGNEFDSSTTESFEIRKELISKNL